MSKQKPFDNAPDFVKTMSGKQGKPVACAEYYVAPTGNDNNPGTESQPFASIERARDAVRDLNRTMSGDVFVYLRGGTHTLTRPLAFGPDDSGANGFRVIYKSFRGESAVLSGGRKVTGWKETDGVWKAEVDMVNVRQLYVNGKRAVRAAIAAPAGLEPWGLHGYRTRHDWIADWPNPSDIEFCYRIVWAHRRCKVASIARNGEYVEIRMQQPYFTLANTIEGVQVQYPDTIENSLAFLKKPGQWYFDCKDRTLYYMPEPGLKMGDVDVIVPVLETLVELRGALEEPVRDISFEGIIFEHATWLRPSNTGFIDLQANFTFGPETLLFARGGSHGCMMSLHCEGTKSPANIVCHAAQGIRFDQCTFTKLGGAGIDLEYGSCSNLIAGCEFCDISGSAIQVGDIQCHDHHPKDPREVVRDNTITNNTIHNVALEYKGGVGVFAGYTDGTTIAHNEIFDLPYSGISVGWGWGEVDAGGGAYVHPDLYDTQTPCGNNRIECNHIHHVIQELDDGGGIYTLGNMPGTVIRGNHVHDSTFNRPGGVYLDEGSGHIEVSGNVVYNVKKALKFNNHAQDRLATCMVKDNVCDVQPEAPEFPGSIAANAGPEAR